MPDKHSKQTVVGISEMKFLLILGVVLIHSNITVEYSSGIYRTNIGVDICNYISSVLCSICVPCFFIISGFLFFKDVENFNFSVYKKKIKTRFFSLFIPYFFWCTLCCIFLYIKSRYLGMPGMNIFLANGEIDWVNLIKGYFCVEASEGFPYAFAFWFIRNLIIFVIISPVARIISKSNVLLVLFFSSYLFGDIYYYGFEWFVLGAALVRFKRYELPINKYYLLTALVIFSGISISRIWINNEHYIFIFQVLSGFYIVYCSAIFLRHRFNKSRIFNSLVISTFSIYATHQCYSTKLRQLLTNILGDSTFIQPIIAYFLSFITMVLLGVIFQLFMNKYFPKTLKLITGGR